MWFKRRRRRVVSDGDANDCVGKGMAGGKVVIKPHQGTAFTCNEATIIGNTWLSYGATGGKPFAAELQASDLACVTQVPLL
ncbi:hypothetical protein O9992_11885 [Vibrio lentus]|nr:hypothetical protein [Vibrio lentus]